MPIARLEARIISGTAERFLYDAWAAIPGSITCLFGDVPRYFLRQIYAIGEAFEVNLQLFQG